MIQPSNIQISAIYLKKTWGNFRLLSCGGAGGALQRSNGMLKGSQGLRVSSATQHLSVPTLQRCSNSNMLFARIIAFGSFNGFGHTAPAIHGATSVRGKGGPRATRHSRVKGGIGKLPIIKG
jgi:hypothetical protein